MPRILFASASAAALLAFAGQASAQVSCQPQLADIAQRASGLPSETDYEITDRLSELYDEALEVEQSDPARCLTLVAEMERLIAQALGGGGSGGASSGGGAGAGGGAGGGGAGGGGGGSAGGPYDPNTFDGRRALSQRQGEDFMDATPVLPVPPLVDTGTAVRPPNAFTESVASHWVQSAEWTRIRLLTAGNEYIEALRETAEEVIAREEDEAEKRRKARAASEAIHKIEEYQRVVLVNEPEDMLAARHADALRRLREASRRAFVQWARDEQARDEFEPAPLTRDDGFEPAPLTRDDGFEPAPLTRGEDFIAPLTRPSGQAGAGATASGPDYIAPLVRPEDQTFFERIRRRINAADAVMMEETRKIAPWIEDRSGFIEPREG